MSPTRRARIRPLRFHRAPPSRRYRTPSGLIGQLDWASHARLPTLTSHREEPQTHPNPTDPHVNSVAACLHAGGNAAAHAGKPCQAIVWNEISPEQVTPNKLVFPSGAFPVKMSQSACNPIVHEKWLFGDPMILCSRDFPLEPWRGARRAASLLMTATGSYQHHCCGRRAGGEPMGGPGDAGGALRPPW